MPERERSPWRGSCSGWQSRERSERRSGYARRACVCGSSPPPSLSLRVQDAAKRPTTPPALRALQLRICILTPDVINVKIPDCKGK
eukprot:492529-Rhodomonas_salina.2